MLGGGPWAIIWKYKGQIATGLAVLALCLYIMTLKSEVSMWQVKATKYEGQVKELTASLEGERQNCSTSLQVQQSSIDDLKKTIARQNAAIATLTKQLEIKNAELVALKKQFEEERERLKQELNAILLEPKPVDCGSSIQYLINGKGDLQWKK